MRPAELVYTDSMTSLARYGFPGRFVGSVLLLGVLVGCAGTPRATLPAMTNPFDESGNAYGNELRWHQACFRFRWEGDEPEFSLDTLVAHRILQPALREFGSNVALWRFHRRAVRDQSGHLFSLIYYSKPQVVEQLHSILEQSELLEKLSSEEVVTSWSTECRQPGEWGDLAAYSDPSWDSRVQTSWPYFIMGVSLSWLALIDEVAAEHSPNHEDLQSLLATYKAVDEEVTQLWQRQGQHAYLHHLNALFGYQPLWIKTPLRF